MEKRLWMRQEVEKDCGQQPQRQQLQEEGESNDDSKELIEASDADVMTTKTRILYILLTIIVSDCPTPHQNLIAVTIMM